MSQQKSLGIEQARAQLPSLVAQAHQGCISVVTKHGKPYAAIVPIDHLPDRRRKPGLLALRGTGRTAWDDLPVSALREEWE